MLSSTCLSQQAGTAQEPVADSKSYGIDQIAFINQKIRQGWKDFGLLPSARAGDGEWCRRLYLDLLGRVPTVEELRGFLRSKSRLKKLRLVEKLLYGEKYREEYAKNWTTLWTNLLIGRNGGNANNSLINRAGMQQYLQACSLENKSYDSMVYELISATGSNTPGVEGFNGAVNFLIDKLGEDAAQATAQTSKIFLGLQVQCTQCHDHPFNQWKQRKYWEMNAFFRQTRALRRYEPGTRKVKSVFLGDQDFAGEGRPATPEEAEIYYQRRNNLSEVAYPVFVDETAISKSGLLVDSNRRQQLAGLIVNSPYLQKTIVNRMWQHFLGYGFTKPVDDMGPHNASSHPELLEYLGEEFREASFDLKILIRWITLSEAYSLSSKTKRKNRSDDPLLGEAPKFSHFYLRQMRAEELYESLLVATEANKTRDENEKQEKNKERWLRQFIVAFGTDEGDETTTFNGTIPQALMMFNGDLMRNATEGTAGSFLDRIAKSKMRPADKINYLFLAALSRKPTKKEIQAANALLVARHGELLEKKSSPNNNQQAKNEATLQALQDVWWALLNSNEFILNH